MHEIYQEICAAASLGQAGPEDLARLRSHLKKCSKCRLAYSDFTDIASQRYAENLSKQSVSPQEDVMLPDPNLLRDRFLQRAREEGILANRQGTLTPSHPSLVLPGFWRQIAKSSAAASMAAVVALLLLPAAYELGRRASKDEAPARASSISSAKTRIETAVPNAHRGAEKSDLEVQIAHLKEDVRLKDQTLRTMKGRLAESSGSSQSLLKARADLENSVDELQQKLRETDGLLRASAAEKAELTEKITESRNTIVAVQASYVADQIRIRELGEEVAEKTSAAERNAHLLERDRDIRDLMTARNLHIFDVFDTDAKGKTRPAFGRIFYTEGKSLIFYAYDLNEAKLTEANYHYRVWGSQEGQKDKVTSLGVFYSDDKAQRRWVFKCKDPKVLGQIDSVFVTLEPGTSDFLHPQGPKMLDAYLGGVANHP